MMRGDIWTVAGSGYVSKPRPAVIIQSDDSDTFDSTIVCLLTSDDSSKASTRVHISPNDQNGLKKDCFVMADKIVTLKKSSLGKRLGSLEDEDMNKVDAALRVAIGI